MNKQDQTSKQDGDQSPNPAEETAAAEQTAGSEAKASDEKNAKAKEKEAELITKLKASQDEAIRLRKAYDELNNSWVKVTPVLKVLSDNPDIMKQVDDAYSGNSTVQARTATQSKIDEALMEKKMAEKLAPVMQEIEFERRHKVEKAFNEFVKKYPDAPDIWEKIERNLKGMKAAGYPLEEGLENSYFLAKKEDAIKQGKKEMAFEIYQRDQASMSGGSSANSDSGDSALTAEEEKVAKELGLKTDDYAGAKLKKQ